MQIGALRTLLTAAETGVITAWRTAAARQAEGELAPEATAHILLDRLTQLAIVLVENRNFEQLKLVLKTLVTLYSEVGENKPPSLFVTPLGLPADVSRWFDIVMRAYVVGAVCVITEEFTPVPDLVFQQPKTQRVGRYWFRDVVTALARNGSFEKKSLIPPIVEYVADRPELFKRFRNDKDRVVAMLCQFDFLQCLLTLLKTEDPTALYTNFATYYSQRTEPIIVQLVTNGPAHLIISDVPEKRLATAIGELDRLASQAGFDFAGWDHFDFQDGRVLEFLRANEAL